MKLQFVTNTFNILNITKHNITNKYNKENVMKKYQYTYTIIDS